MKKYFNLMTPQSRIYLDAAASTPLDPAVAAAMTAALGTLTGNPAATHGAGQAVASALDLARETVAMFCGCTPAEIIFTSGATESNNLAIQGVVRAWTGKGKPHVVTSAIEHPSVAKTCQWLAAAGQIDLTVVPASADGLVSVDDILSALQPNTALVSVMYVNNEVGSIQPIVQIGRALRKQNEKRPTPILFHCDAVQAAAYLPCRVDELGVDLLTLSAHKLHGPAGVGALYRRRTTPLRSLGFGGDQEYELRPGTPNSLGIIGFGAAVGLLQPADRQQVSAALVMAFRDQLWADIQALGCGAVRHGSPVQSAPHILNIALPGVDAELLVVQLDRAGVAVATGSACAAGSVDPSPTLLALGCPLAEVRQSVRLSVSRLTTTADIQTAVERLAAVLQSIR